MSDLHAVAASTVFDGTVTLDDHAVLIEHGDIADIVPRAALRTGIPLHNLPDGDWLAPGFIDIQVNGGGDVLFNDTPTPKAIRAIVAAHRRFGTTSLLPTLISDSDEKMNAALDAVGAVMATEPGVLGIHLEGPFLSPERAGVHTRALIRPPKPHHRDMLASRQAGVTLVTLAPEQVPVGFIRELVSRGVIVAFGHSMATYEQTRAALSEGLTGFTHLFNAMRPLTSREPGPIAAALESPHVFYGLIVDGEHVAPAMLRLAMRGVGTPMLVTDAMPPVGGARNSFMLHGQEITVERGKLMTRNGTLAGASLDMATAVRNCVQLLGLDLAHALRLASFAPAKFLGLGDKLGSLALHHRADMVALSGDEIRVRATWVAGNAQ